MTTREGIEIDYCPECRGVWLDRGELDKLIERSNVGQQQGYAPQPQQQFEQRRDERRHDNDDDYRRDNSHDQHGKRKKNTYEKRGS